MKKIAICLVFLMLFLVACDSGGKMADSATLWIDVYYSRGDRIDSEQQEIELGNSLKKMVGAAIEKMCEEPLEESLNPALPEGIEVNKISVQSGVFDIDFSEKYLALSPADMTIANVCVLKTIESFTKVKSLNVSVNGEEVISELNSEQVCLDDPKVYLGEDEIEVYLYNRDGGLSKRKMKVERKNGTIPELIAVDLLLSGNASYSSPLPKGCRANSLSVSAGVCHIDFSGEFLTCPEENTEKMLRAVVLTLTSVDYIDRVKITVDGESVRGFDKISLLNEYTRENFADYE